jgi:hypothetical protein
MKIKTKGILLFEKLKTIEGSLVRTLDLPKTDQS